MSRSRPLPARGRLGAMAHRGARPGDWKAFPMPEERARLQIAHRYSAEEMDQIREGLVPEEMEDKWFIVWDGTWLRAHRSWTGYCIYELSFFPIDGGYAVAQAWANRNPAQYAPPDEARDAHLLVWLIDVHLLGRYSRPPSP
jgi:hypothetical protein